MLFFFFNPPILGGRGTTYYVIDFGYNCRKENPNLGKHDAVYIVVTSIRIFNFYSMNPELYAMRASGFVPVIPLRVTNKDTQLPMYI